MYRILFTTEQKHVIVDPEKPDQYCVNLLFKKRSRSQKENLGLEVEALPENVGGDYSNWHFKLFACTKSWWLSNLNKQREKSCYIYTFHQFEENQFCPPQTDGWSDPLHPIKHSRASLDGCCGENRTKATKAERQRWQICSYFLPSVWKEC